MSKTTKILRKLLTTKDLYTTTKINFRVIHIRFSGI